MNELHELHCKDVAGTVDIKKCKQNIATLARPTYSSHIFYYQFVIKINELVRFFFPLKPDKLSIAKFF